MKPKHIKCNRRKEVRAIQKRQRAIYKEKRDLGYITLKKPIRHGWFKEIVITHRIEQYKNKAAIREVYDKIEKVFWGRTKEEAEQKWLQETAKYLISKEVPTLSKREHYKLSDAAKYLCVPFNYRAENKKMKLRYYVKIPKGAYRIKFTRAYITHSKRIDPNLERETALLAQQLLKHGYYEANEKLYQWKDYWNIYAIKKEKLKLKKGLGELRKHSIQDLVNNTVTWERN